MKKYIIKFKDKEITINFVGEIPEITMEMH